MTEYKRVIVTAADLPQHDLAGEFMSLNGNGMLGTEDDELILIAKPDEVHEFIDEEGATRGWDEYVEDVTIEDIDDVDELPDPIANAVKGVVPQCWHFAAELIPDGEDFEDYFWQGRVNFSCTESVIDKKNAYPASVDDLQTWIEDDEFSFDSEAANPTQNMEYDGGALEWAEMLHEAHPDAEMKFIGDVMGPNNWEPHGSAFLDGIAITMRDADEIADDVLAWAQNHFDAEYDEQTDRYVPHDEDAFITNSDEFGVYERDGREWIRMWWD